MTAALCSAHDGVHSLRADCVAPDVLHDCTPECAHRRTAPSGATNADVVALLAEAFPEATVEIHHTGGGCMAVRVAHPSHPDTELLLGDGDAHLLLRDPSDRADDDGPFRYEVWVGEYGENVDERCLLHITREDLDALVAAEGEQSAVRSVIVRVHDAVAAWVGAPTSDAYAQTVLGMVRDSVRDGEVPADVTSFSDLHDHVDANCYLIDAAVPFPDAVDDVDTALVLLNHVMDSVHAAIGRGEHVPTPED